MNDLSQPNPNEYVNSITTGSTSRETSMHTEEIEVITKVTGYVAKCSCGWKGEVQSTAVAANQEFLVHYGGETGTPLV